MTTVRPIRESDRDAWLPLWHGYNAFYRNQPAEEVTRVLIEGVYEEADRRGADRVYWHTQQYNAQARSLYDAVAHATSFVVHQR